MIRTSVTLPKNRVLDSCRRRCAMLFRTSSRLALSAFFAIILVLNPATPGYFVSGQSATVASVAAESVKNNQVQQQPPIHELKSSESVRSEEHTSELQSH